MSGTSWLVDQNRIASKIRTASVAYDPERVEWKSNPSRSCPNCEFVIDNADVAHAWPGLPSGVKFDPSDQEIVWHLLSKSGDEKIKPHPFIDEFIPTVKEDDGICYTHPQNLPGVKQDGSVSHFFHRAIKAYNTGTRKRRKIHGVDCGDVRWHKTGRTKPILLNGVQKGCKKIMVLYISSVRGGKAEKTNWVMHQYHLGTEEDEKEGEYVLSKVFYQQQQQQTKPTEKSEEDNCESVHTTTVKVDPVTPKSIDPEPRPERSFSKYDSLLDSTFPSIEHLNEVIMEDKLEVPSEHSNDQDQINVENLADQVADDNNVDDAAEDDKWWDDELLMSSQQLVEGLSLCDDLLQSQSPNRDEQGQAKINKPRLADYARLGPNDLKRDLEECQKLPSHQGNAEQNDLANIDFDTPPDFRLSQLEFDSQDSYIAWGGSCQGGKVVLD